MMKLFHLFGKKFTKMKIAFKMLNFLSFGKADDLYGIQGVEWVGLQWQAEIAF